MSYDIKDISLWESGETKIQWVKSNMDLLRGIEEEFIKTKPFKGLRVALSVHLEVRPHISAVCLHRAVRKCI